VHSPAVTRAAAAAPCASTGRDTGSPPDLRAQLPRPHISSPPPPLLPHPARSRRDFLYNVGKVLVFLTAMPRRAGGRHWQRHVEILREAQAAVAKCPPFLPAFLLLLEPGLDPGRAEKSDAEVNAVDLVLTLLKQLLEIPGPSEAELAASAVGSADSVAAVDVGDKLLRKCAAAGILDTVADISALVERREFRRLAVVLLDFWFQLLKTTDADALVRAHVRLERETAAAAARKAAARATATAGSGQGASGAHLSSSSRAAPSSYDPFAEARKAEKAAAASSRASALSSRHSNFGTLIKVNAFGTQRVVNKLTGGAAAAVAGDTSGAGRAGRRTKSAAGGGAGAGGRKKGDDDTPPLVVDVRDERVGLISSGPGGSAAVASILAGVNGGSAGVAGRREEVLRLLYALALRFTQPAALPVDPAAAAAADEDEASASAAPVAGFAALAKALKGRFARESEEILPEDRLRYFHTTSVLLGCYRADGVAKAKEAAERRRRDKGVGAAGEDDDDEEEEEDAAGGAAYARFDATPIVECFDRWSFSNVLSSIASYTDRKQWQAVSIAAAHLRELILGVFAMVEHGDRDTRSLGARLADDLFREGEVSDAIPRLLRLFEPGRFPPSFVPNLVEAAHYLLKLAERAAREGLRVRGRKRGGGRAAGGKGKAAGGKGAGDDGGDNDEDGGLDMDGGDDGGEGGAAAAASRLAELKREARSERAFQVDRYTGEYAHPGVVAAYIHALRSYASNGPKLNYYIVSLLRRVAELPNDAAGTDPRDGGKPLTFRVLLYHVSVLSLATDILSDKAVVSGSRDDGPFFDVYGWARSLSRSFLRDTKENPMLFVEALFWRAEKGANAEVASHYGLITGVPLTGEGADAAGGRKKSKAAIAADEAEAEARRNAAARYAASGGAGAGAGEDSGPRTEGGDSAGLGDDEEAQVRVGGLGWRWGPPSVRSHPHSLSLPTTLGRSPFLFRFFHLPRS
jgi:hypothetical protein